MIHFRARLVLAGALLLLAGCSVFSKPKATPPCPGVSLVPDVNEAAFYRETPGRDLTDVRFRAAVGDAKGSCAYKGDTLQMDMTVLLLAERGPALGDREPADFEYFVALADNQRQIVSKSVFKGRVVFPAGQDRVGFPDDLTIGPVRLPNADLGPEYTILLGLQLTPEQVELNRRRGPRRTGQ
jgi:hypothetical protein